MTDQTVTTPEETPESAEPAVAPETPEVSGEEPSPEAPEVPEAETDQPAEPVLPETVEVEWEGSTYSVPKALEGSFMMHADYTRKTQEIADKSRELDTEREAHGQQVEIHRQHLQDFGQLAYLDGVLQQFREINLPELHQQDPEKAQEIAFQFQMARDQREQIVERLQKREHEARLQTQREYAKRKEHLEATLARDIPNYSPDLRSKMTETATRAGISKEEMDGVTDPRYMRLLHLAHLGEQVLKKTAAPKPKPTEPVKPLPKAAGGPPPSSGPRDNDSTEAWMKRRNEQLRKRGR